MASFEGKVIIVTGSSSGIGAETAVQFAERGGKVVITGRNTEGLAATRERCLQTTAVEDNVLVVEADLTKTNDIDRLIQSTLDKYGAIDVLVNNAGVFVTCTDFFDTSAELVNDVFNTNTMSVFNVTKRAMKHLMQAKGNVVNVSSMYGHRPVTGFLPTALSKAAIDQLTKCLALEFAQAGVRVNAVNPGHTKTPLFLRTGTVSTAEEQAKFFADLAEMYPLGRIGRVTDIVNAILFLASEEAGFITGALLGVDGGMSVSMPGAINTQHV